MKTIQHTQDPIIQKFRTTSFKIAVQKNGELTDLSHLIISHLLHNQFTSHNNSKRLISVSDKGDIGIFWAKNKSMFQLVADGFVDAAVLGNDQILEENENQNVVIINNLKKVANWPIVIATPIDSHIKKMSQIQSIATQYPNISRRFFTKRHLPIKIIPFKGSCEGSVYLSPKINAVVDIAVTGMTLRDNGLRRWLNPITYVYPVIIANAMSLQQKDKRNYFVRLKKHLTREDVYEN